MSCQKSVASLDDKITDVSDLEAASDTVLIAKVTKINWAQKVNDRFRTPLDIECLETLKGEESRQIYMDGGKMLLIDYKDNALDVLAGDYADLYIEGMQRTQHVTIVPLNYIDLEEGKTYLFYLKDGMIINGGYGVFEQTGKRQFQNVITKLEMTKEDNG